MNYNKEFKLIEPFIYELFKYKYLDSLPIKEKEYVNYLIDKLDTFVSKIIKYGNKKDIFYLGNFLFDLFIEYNIPLFEKYFDELNI